MNGPDLLPACPASIAHESQLDYTAHDALDLTMSLLSGTTNEFELQSRKRPPLPFDRLKRDNSIPATNSPPFMRLPTELLEQIVLLLPNECLSPFAGVNRDCRLLARAIQFEHLQLRYTNIDLEIVNNLSLESVDHTTVRDSQRLSLGPCIRRLKVNTLGGYFSWRHGLESETFIDRPTAESDAILQLAADHYFGRYMPRVLHVIKYGLPNLEQLEWDDRIMLSGSAWSAILISSIRHLKLYRVHYDDKTYEAIKNLPPMLSEQLESLSLEVCPAIRPNFEVAKSGYAFAVEVLNRCPALKHLEWCDWLSRLSRSNLRDNGRQLLRLRNLRSLSLTAVECASQSDTAALIGAPGESKLNHLSLVHTDERTVTHLGAMGRIPSLKSFAWDDRSNPPIEFLQQNDQLELLSLRNCTASFIDTTVLPLLAAQYKKLQSLELVYPQDHSILSETATSVISRLTSLVKLHLQLGFPVGWRRTWLVNHKAIRNCIKYLPDLKVLALSRDTYDWERTNNRSLYEAYYDDPILSLHPRDYPEGHLMETLFSNSTYENIGLQARQEFCFEMVHRRRMLQQARRYVDLRWGDLVDGRYQLNGPKLEFIYFGELPMRVRMGWYGYRPMAVSERRDALDTFLARTFRNDTDLFGDD